MQPNACYLHGAGECLFADGGRDEMVPQGIRKAQKGVADALTVLGAPQMPRRQKEPDRRRVLNGCTASRLEALMQRGVLIFVNS